MLPRTDRRQFLTLSTAAAAGIAGCATAKAPVLAPAPGSPAGPWTLDPTEARLAADKGAELPLVVRGKDPAGVLRRRARPVPPDLDLGSVAARMERTMRRAGGVGLAGPQVGLSLRIATLMLDYRTDHPRVVFVRNPVITRRSDETQEGYEGCLSVPGVGGRVRRSAWVRLQHTALSGEVLEQEADGPNAVLWQHELDHLDGVLFLDRLLGQLLPMDEVRRRRERERQREDLGPASAPSGRSGMPGPEGRGPLLAELPFELRL